MSTKEEILDDLRELWSDSYSYYVVTTAETIGYQKALSLAETGQFQVFFGPTTEMESKLAEIMSTTRLGDEFEMLATDGYTMYGFFEDVLYVFRNGGYTFFTGGSPAITKAWAIRDRVRKIEALL